MSLLETHLLHTPAGFYCSTRFALRVLKTKTKALKKPQTPVSQIVRDPLPFWSALFETISQSHITEYQLIMIGCRLEHPLNTSWQEKLTLRLQASLPPSRSLTSWPFLIFLHDPQNQLSWYVATGQTGEISSAVCSPPEVQERWRVGETNICSRVLLDVVRAKTHKAGYYLCKSTRVAEPVGKTSSITTSSELDSSSEPQHQLDTEYRELTLALFQPGQKNIK